tara:strand:+ start:411 stop:533 length:123 start_codon:yes stop_codon:yes gene_type:complete
LEKGETKSAEAVNPTGDQRIAGLCMATVKVKLTEPAECSD